MSRYCAKQFPHPHDYTRKAGYLVASGHPAQMTEAIALLEKGHYDYPSDVFITRDLGRLYRITDQIQLSLSILFHGWKLAQLEQEPRFKKIHLKGLSSEIAKSYMEDRDFLQAQYYFKVAAEVEPADPKKQAMLAEAYIAGYNFDQADRILVPALELNPQHADLRLAKIRFHRKCSEFAIASEIVEREIAKGDTGPRLVAHAGLLHLLQEQWEPAEKAFAMAARSFVKPNRILQTGYEMLPLMRKDPQNLAAHRRYILDKNL